MTDRPDAEPADTLRDDPAAGFIDLFGRIAAEAGPDGAAVAAIVDRLEERAAALLILALTIPCLVPGLPGAQIIAVPIFLLCAQIALGRREPWLPGWFMRAQVKKAWLEGVAGFAAKSLRWTERLARPRLKPLATGAGERVVALAMALAAVTIMLPITNTIPSIALTLASVGLIQRDGLFTLLGAALALAWVATLGTLIVALALGAAFAVRLIEAHAPWLADWLGLAAP